jgi:hypothetical protein
MEDILSFYLSYRFVWALDTLHDGDMTMIDNYCYCRRNDR